MTILTGYDAAYPAATPPVKTQVVEVYIGGDTPHVWTDADIARQTAEYLLPVFVRSNPPGPGVVSDYTDIVNAFRSHGWPTDGKAVMMDIEVANATTYLLPLASRLHAIGMKVLVYGSRSALPLNPILDGRIDANPGTPAHVDTGDDGTQYYWGGTYDLDVFDVKIRPWLIDRVSSKATVVDTPPVKSTVENKPVPVVATPTTTKITESENESMAKVFCATSDASGGVVATGFQCVVFDNGKVVYIPHEQDLEGVHAAYGPSNNVTGDFISNLINGRTN